MWDAIAERVQAVLADSVRWTGGKQRLTATRLHALLLAEGKRVGVTVVKEAVAEWKRQRREVFVPLTYRPGDLAEVDFFEVLVDVDGIRRKAWLFLMRLMYLGPRLRVDLRAAGSDQFSRWPRPGLCAFRWRTGARRLRQSPGRGRPDPGRRCAHVDAAVRGARLALPTRSLFLPTRGRAR